MFWQEDDKKDVVTTSDRVVDLSFRIECREIPASHAWELAQALYRALPWIEDEPEVGVHQIHGATSGNGWERPPDSEMIQLSKRTRMNLRVPVSRVDDAGKLEGEVLDVAGSTVTVGKMASKAVEPFSTIFARYVVVPEDHDEEQFLQWVVNDLRSRNIQARKLLCGIGHKININGEAINTRSLMIADLDKEASVVLQETGIGPHRHFGCGIFLPHKGIKAVSEQEDKSHFSGN